MTAVTAAVAAARERALWLRVAISADAAALLALGAFTVAVAALTWGTWGDLKGDTGHDFVAGTRFAHGQLPYVDGIYYYGPLGPALLGLAAVVGGAGVDPFLTFGLAVACAIVLATYALARQHVGPRAALLAGAITAPVAFATHQFSFVLPHTSAATLGTLTLLCFLLALGRFAIRGGARWLVAAGVCLGLTTLTKPEFVFAAGAAAGAWLLLRALAGERSPREWALLLGPALAIPCAVYGAFLTAVSAHTLLFENLDPRAFLQTAGNTILRARAPLTPTSFAQLGAKLALYAVGVLGLLVLGRLLASPGRRRRLVLGVLTLAAFAAALAAVKDPEALRHGLLYAYGWIPAGAAVALVVLLVRFRTSSGGWSPDGQLAVAGTVALAVLAGTNYAGFYAYAWKPQLAAYAIPLAAVFLVRLHLVELATRPNARAVGAGWLVLLAAAGLGLTLRDAHAESGTVRGPGGALREAPAVAAAYQHAVGWITARTRPGEPILLAPQMTSLYVMTGRQDVLPQLSLLPGALDGPADERAAIRLMDDSGLRLAIVDRRPLTRYDHGTFGVEYDRLIGAWLRRDFNHIKTLRGPAVGGEQPRILDVWLRRTR